MTVHPQSAVAGEGTTPAASYEIVRDANTRALGCEGIVSKRLGSTYRSGRAVSWLKVKNPAAPALAREAIAGLIHENFWIVLSFAFGRPAITEVIEKYFKGEWKYFHKSVYENVEIRADRALLEMATQLRVLDDAEQLSECFKQTKRAPLGIVVQADGTTTELHFRDMTNKLMHRPQV